MGSMKKLICVPGRGPLIYVVQTNCQDLQKIFKKTILKMFSLLYFFSKVAVFNHSFY